MLTGLVADLADELCAGRLAFVLEGGYDLDALSSGLVATLERLNSRAGADPPLLELSPVTQTAIERAARHHHLTS
jgi:acetoin utilization deacetylase AcuC-like enzyme